MAARIQGLKRLEQTKQIVAIKLKKDWDDAKPLVKEASDAVNEKASVLGKYHFGSQENVALKGAGYVKFENSGNIHRGTAEDLGKAAKTSVGKTPSIQKVEYGEHIKKGLFGRKELKPNIQYVTEDGYRYTTDEFGRIVNVEADNLVLKEGKRNEAMQRIAGRQDRLPDDDGGHLIATQFNGPGDIDNLVAQNKQINRAGGEWYNMEQEWANALKEVPPRKVSVNIEPIYSNKSMRPDSFLIEYEIERQFPVIREIANKRGG